MGPLSGVRVVELAGLAPVPYAGMILADFGADVIRVDRARPGAEHRFDATRDSLGRGKRSIGLNLKAAKGIDLLLRLLEGADVLLEPFRPGVMEKLGVGPDAALARNPKLVYARLTGWGQTGPYASMAGHDINYIALSGALGLFGRKGEKPLPPVNLVGDFAGGGMLCAMGVVLALFERTRSGAGQVVDSAMVDGAAHLASFIFGFHGAGFWSSERGTNMLDTGAPFYDTYETADGRYVSVGAIEPQFYAALLEGLGVPAEQAPQWDREQWPQTAALFTRLFQAKTRDAWSEIFDGTDACVAPVLELAEVASHPHNQARRSFVRGVGDMTFPDAAPRLSRTPGAVAPAAPLPGGDTRTVLEELGLTGAEMEALESDGVIG